MKLIIASVVLLAVLAVLTPAADAFNPVQEVRCVKRLLDNLSNTVAAEREWVGNKRRLFEQLRTNRKNCETISDVFSHEQCLDTQQGRHNLEVMILLAEVERKESPERAAQLLRDFESCRSR